MSFVTGISQQSCVGFKSSILALLYKITTGERKLREDKVLEKEKNLLSTKKKGGV